LAKETGSSVHPASIGEAHEAEIVFLAVPFTSHNQVAEEFGDWNGKIIVDVTNALHVAPQSLGGRLSSEIVADAFVGARLVKAFNHLPAAQLGTNPSLPGQGQAIFVSGNDADANATVAALVARLGLAPVDLGRLDQGGVPLHVVNGRPGGLLFQNLATLG
jgi:hypothetical protein